MEGIGTTLVWGFSRALDLQRRDALNEMPLTEAGSTSTADQEPLKMLLVGSGDIRHIVKTIAHNWRHGNRELHFYIVEPQVTTLARMLLLLSIFCEQDTEMGLEERTETFLELYGNILLRQRTGAFVQERASELIRLITGSFTNLEKKLPVAVNLDSLKFRERDDLEFAFNFWRDEKKKFDIVALRDLRLQKYYGTRYDVRENVVDWDFQMKLKEKAPTINAKEFLRWRMHGQAFEIRESTVSVANRTLATVELMKQNGLSVTKWGYFSDIVVGPFLAFGTYCEDDAMLKVVNGTRVKTAKDISHRNVKALLHEYHHGQVFVERSEREVPEGKIEEIEEDNPAKVMPPYTPSKSVLHLLPADMSHLLPKLVRKHSGSFDRIYIGSTMAHRIPDLKPLMRSDGVMLVESAKFIFDLSQEQALEFDKRVLQLALEASLQTPGRTDSRLNGKGAEATGKQEADSFEFFAFAHASIREE
ncbi:hypothetical protein BC832DRAFT_122164 [Gaertneriomyces semiglobifer]|nr:hypothetical protein BC832DRAFT_247169 [Gaertneriomyces semiglobifer]KAI9002436.1 hypothetical protein BC832DRAFT_122164 [Gaertneriomyces semiglobifer]